jgi:hypothetical protein
MRAIQLDPRLGLEDAQRVCGPLVSKGPAVDLARPK